MVKGQLFFTGNNVHFMKLRILNLTFFFLNVIFFSCFKEESKLDHVGSKPQDNIFTWFRYIHTQRNQHVHDLVISYTPFFSFWVLSVSLYSEYSALSQLIHNICDSFPPSCTPDLWLLSALSPKSSVYRWYKSYKT